MKESSLTSSEKEDPLGETLEKIKKTGDLIGVIFTYRDGTSIKTNIDKDFNDQTFAAMCASVMGSAETLGATIRDQASKKIIVEMETQNIMMMGCDPRTFLIFIFHSNSKMDKLMKKVDGYIQKLTQLY